VVRNWSDFLSYFVSQRKIWMRLQVGEKDAYSLRRFVWGADSRRNVNDVRKKSWLLITSQVSSAPWMA